MKTFKRIVRDWESGKTHGRAMAFGITFMLIAGFGMAILAQETAAPTAMAEVPTALTGTAAGAGVPQLGTFYMLNNYEQPPAISPPYPFNPFPQAPVYSLSNGAFLVEIKGMMGWSFAKKFSMR